MSVVTTPFEGSCGWQRLDKIISTENKLGESPYHKPQLCNQCRIAPFCEDIGTSKRDSSRDYDAVFIGLFSTLLIKQDFCDVCRLIVRSCQVYLSDSEFEDLLRRGLGISIVQVPLIKDPFWGDLHLQQLQEVQTANILSGCDTSHAVQVPDEYRVARIGVGTWGGAQPGFSALEPLEAVMASQRGIMVNPSVQRNPSMTTRRIIPENHVSRIRRTAHREDISLDLQPVVLNGDEGQSATPNTPEYRRAQALLGWNSTPTTTILDAQNMSLHQRSTKGHFKVFDWTLWKQRLGSDHSSLSWVNPSFSTTRKMCSEQLLGWLKKCTTVHGLACTEDLHPTHASVLVIDVETRQINCLKTGQRFAALSYVWGDKKLCKAASDGTQKQLPSAACRTIEDAILVTKRLGLQYLWADRYCIAAETAEKHVQIKHMSEVYSAAHVTIIALDGVSCEAGLAGVSRPLKRTHIRANTGNEILIASNSLDPIRSSNKTVWKTRAWTLQEAAMSRRRLGFLSDIIFLECNEELFLDRLESRRDSHPIQPCLHLDGVSYGSKIIKGQWSFDKYSKLIEEYTRRKMTFASDALAAIEGVLAHITKKTGVKFIHGHPVDDFAYSLLWSCDTCHWRSPTDQLDPERFRDQNTMWRHILEAVRRALREDNTYCDCLQRRFKFPFWSWSGWSGPVTFPFTILGTMHGQKQRIIATRCNGDEHGSYFKEVEKLTIIENRSEDKGFVRLRTFVGRLQFIDVAHSMVGFGPGNDPLFHGPPIEIALLLEWKPCDKNGNECPREYDNIRIQELGGAMRPDPNNLDQDTRSRIQMSKHNLILVTRIVRGAKGELRRADLFRISPYLWAKANPQEAVLEVR